MKSVQEIFNSDIGYKRSQELIINGWLVVSSCLSYLATSEDNQNQCILVVEPDLYGFLQSKLPIRCGSMVSFVGSAQITGNIVKSGMDPLPYAFSCIKKLKFSEKSGGDVIYLPPPKEYIDYLDL